MESSKKSIEGEPMILVIPTNSNKGIDDSIAEHFGRCKTYTGLHVR